MLKSKVWARPFWRMFRHSDAAEKQMTVQLLRAVVVHEDLLLELAGAVAAEQLTSWGHAPENQRRLYFVRRALASAWEIRQVVEALQRNKAFKTAKGRMGAESRDLWDRAVAFFAAHHAFLRSWRNAVGGHFTDAAAQFVLEHCRSDQACVVELYDRGDGVRAHFKCAHVFVCAALSLEQEPGEDEVAFLRRSFEIAQAAQVHAVHVAQVLAAEVLMAR